MQMLSRYLKPDARVQLLGTSGTDWYNYLRHNDKHIWFTDVVSSDTDWYDLQKRKHRYLIEKLYAVSYFNPDGVILITNHYICHTNRDDKFHRLDGPALYFFSTGKEIFYINGIEYTESEFKFWRQVRDNT